MIDHPILALIPMFLIFGYALRDELLAFIFNKIDVDPF